MVFTRPEIHTKIRFVAVLLIVVSLPFSMLVNNISIMLLGANWLLESSPAAKWNRLKQNPLFFWFILLYLLYLIGMLYSDNARQGVFELEKKLGLVVFPLVLASSEPFTPAQLKTFFKGFFFSCLAAIVVCFSYAGYLNYVEGHNLQYIYRAVFYDEHVKGKYNYLNYWYFTYKLFSAPLHIHPIYLAMYLLFSACQAVWLWWDRSWKKRSLNFLVLAYLVLNFTTIVLLSSRTQLFAAVFAGTVFVIYEAYARKKLLHGILFVFLIIGLGLLFVLSNPVIRERIIESNRPGTHFTENKYGEGGLSLRLYKWKYAIETIGRSPIFGTGTGDAQDQLQLTYQANDFKIGFENNFNTHNQFLQTLLEIGIPGLIGLLCCLFLPLYAAIRRKNLLYAFFIVLFFISCLTESMLETNKGIAFYAVFNSLFAFHLLKRDAPI